MWSLSTYLTCFWEESQGSTHPAAGTERIELGFPYRGILPGIVVENPTATWMSVCPASNIVDFAIDHQPLVGLLIVSLDLLPTVQVEALSRCVTFSICLLLWGDLCFAICFWFVICLMLLPYGQLILSYKAPIACMLFSNLHHHRTPEISELTPETSNPHL